MADINTWLEGEEYSKLRLQGGSVNFGHYCGVLRSAASDPRAEARAWSSARHLGDRSQALPGGTRQHGLSARQGPRGRG
jgi:hypothetical protein